MLFRMYVSYEALVSISLSTIVLAFVNSHFLWGFFLIPVIAFFQKRDAYTFRHIVRGVYTRLLFLRSSGLRWPGSFD